MSGGGETPDREQAPDPSADRHEPTPIESAAQASASDERKAKRSSWPRILALLAVGLMVVVGIGAALGYRQLLIHMVRTRARAMGLNIEAASYQVGLGSVRMTDVRVSLVGVRGVRARIQRVNAFVDRFTPSRVDCQGLSVDVVGAAPDVVMDLGEWTKDHPTAFAVPLSADNIGLSWREVESTTPWLVLEGAQLSPFGSGGVMRSDRVRVAGIAVGKTAAVWSADRATVSLGFGREDLAIAPIRVDIRVAEPRSLKVTISPMGIGDLSAPLGIPIELRGVSVEGTAEVTLPGLGTSGPLEGTVHIVLRGYIPPHPPELEGIVFGDRTTVDAKVSISADRTKVAMAEVALTAGALKLTGTGSAERHEGYASILLKLVGALPCGALARNVLRNHLGKTVGGLVGGIASQVIGGSVSIAASVQADTRNLSTATIQQSAVLGCRLQVPTL